MTGTDTATDLTQILEHGLSVLRESPVRIASLKGEALEMRSTHPISRLHLGLASGEELAVIFKRQERATERKGGPREVLVYQRLLAGQRFGAPELYASVYDAARAHYWLFLEDVGDQTITKGDWEEWFAAVRWLAAMHGTYWDREEELRPLACLEAHGAEYYRRIIRAARQNLKEAGAWAALPLFDDLTGQFQPAVAELVRWPRTLVHGDIFAHNLFLQPGPRIRPIDWEEAAIGLGVWDLVRLLDGWEKELPTFVAVYLAELARHAAAPFDRRDFDRVFRRCEFLNALWHLGWDVEACRDAAFVQGSLAGMRAIVRQLDEAKSDG